MPEEVAVLIALAIIGGVAIKIASIIIEYLRTRSKAGDGSITASELHRIVETAVRDAVEPLHQQLQEMERLQLPQTFEDERPREFERAQLPLASEGDPPQRQKESTRTR
jgi:ribosomal protein S13